MKTEYTLRHPVVSGLFYPDEKEELEGMVQGYIDKIDRQLLFQSIREQTGLKNPETIAPMILIAPHAGYIFSAKVQAYAYSLLINTGIETAVIIGPAHQKAFKGISVNLDNAYRTPIGNVEVDLDFSKRIISQNDKITLNEEAHLREHAIEVQIPFIQTVLKNCKVVPILIGEQNWETSEILKNALIEVLKENPDRYIVIISTDLSHYHPHIEAQSYDKVLIQDIIDLDADSLYSNIQSGNTEACGFGGILTGLMLVKELGKGKSAVLHYMDSGEVSGDRKKVVGYIAAALY